MPEFRAANPGFHFDFQLVNVDEGSGESEPTPYFYQVMELLHDYGCTMVMHFCMVQRENTLFITRVQ